MLAIDQFDAVVVGSGFGGSVTSYRLAEAGRSVCLFERGKAYPPGSFPRTPRQMSSSFWDPSNGGHGLFQVWAFGDMEALVAAGLGGGSLIYANVTLRKDEKWFVKEESRQPGYEYWPITRQDLDPHYQRVEDMLRPQTYPFKQPPYSLTAKTIAFQEAAGKSGLPWLLPPLAVTFANAGRTPAPGEVIEDGQGRPVENLHHQVRRTCELLGECDLGCNIGAKNTLDYNYLTQAKRLGVEIRTLSEVRSFEPREGGGYLIRYVEHLQEAEGRRTDTRALPVRTVVAKQLVLSAGVFGSTYLMLRNRHAFPGLSRRLGTNFSGNGDLLGFVHSPATNRDFDPMRGPSITSATHVPDEVDGGTGRGFYLEEGGFPPIMGWALEAADTPHELHRFIRFVLRRLRVAVTHSRRSDLGGEVRAVVGDGSLSSGVLVLLGMGRDTPDGKMSLHDRWLELKWNRSNSQAYFDRVKAAMASIATALDARFTINPLWYLHNYVTVHGLGGCPMGRTADEGVVSPYGEVFGYPNFYVADGSVMPGSIGPNPSLTIAAVADRFADHMTGRVG